MKAKGFGRRITRKAKWGMKELLCLVRLSEQGKVDLTRLKGSWAGAFGMPQFIPTSFEAYGVDWDRDGRVDLDTLSDAAASAANYLHSHGWKKTLTRKKALRIIKFYNLSHPIELNRMLSAVVSGIVESSNDAQTEARVVESWLSKYLIGEWGVYGRQNTPPGFPTNRNPWNVGIKRGEGYMKYSKVIPPAGDPPPIYIRGYPR